MDRRKTVCLVLALALLLGVLCGCGETIRDGETPLGWFGKKSAVGTEPTAEPEDRGAYVAPPFADAAYHPELAQSNGRAAIDLSAAAEGYVAVSAVSDHRLKFQVKTADSTYNYDLASDGSPSIFPLQSGDGVYLFRVMENVVDKKYAEMYSVTGEVRLADEFQPFLRPNDYIPYTQESECVIKAAELAETAGDRLGLIAAVYRFVCATVRYDVDKANSVKSGYMPDPDETMRTGKGICFDYASLAGAMLRSQGIPTKEIFGYVSPDDLYHAWNMIYTEETGWIAVSFEVSGENWNRLDLTFLANGADASFVGDGSNYTDIYFY